MIESYNFILNQITVQNVSKWHYDRIFLLYYSLLQLCYSYQAHNIGLKFGCHYLEGYLYEKQSSRMLRDRVCLPHWRFPALHEPKPLPLWAEHNSMVTIHPVDPIEWGPTHRGRPLHSARSDYPRHSPLGTLCHSPVKQINSFYSPKIDSTDRKQEPNRAYFLCSNTLHYTNTIKAKFKNWFLKSNLINLIWKHLVASLYWCTRHPWMDSTATQNYQLSTYVTYVYAELFVSGNVWKCRSHTFSSKTLFISLFYFETLYKSNNAFHKNWISSFTCIKNAIFEPVPNASSVRQTCRSIYRKWLWSCRRQAWLFFWTHLRHLLTALELEESLNSVDGRYLVQLGQK